ncbi:MAG: D,D-heptose 1,7-bisphosphate phosphatase [Gammaproteobacteria bacterium]|jgi:D-glycero-D-manno-heptose 1,7-bisphosphate phosphatase|nr:D,D-heptose 1,7-bisphosphate phosphatase [Gammaproteobacteria bacterium]
MKLVLLDRDGVINFDSKEYIKSPKEWLPIPGSMQAIALLTQAGYRVAVLTNQSGVGRGLYDLQTLAQIHEKMLRNVQEAGGKIEIIFYCPHLPEQNCDCRKPKPGLFFKAKEYFACDLQGVWAVGDSKRDLEASAVVGCQPVLVKTGNGAALLAKETLPKEYLVFDDLLAVAQALTAEHQV